MTIIPNRYSSIYSLHYNSHVRQACGRMVKKLIQPFVIKKTLVFQYR